MKRDHTPWERLKVARHVVELDRAAHALQMATIELLHELREPLIKAPPELLARVEALNRLAFDNGDGTSGDGRAFTDALNEVLLFIMDARDA